MRQPAQAANPRPDRRGFVRGLSTAGFHKIAYTDWGPADATETVICVHGLTRQGRDFDFLAAALASQGFRVICPDLVGRGRSEWLPNAIDYVFPQYCSDMATLVSTLGAGTVHWVGTSLGGLIGMVLAGSRGSPISKLVVNDIGPDVPASASARVGLRLAREPASFGSLAEAETHARIVHQSCGTLTDEQWRHLTIHSLRLDPESDRFVPLIDPKVSTAYYWLWYYQMSLWSYWRRLEGPVLTVRGADSDFLSKSLLGQMRKAVPHMQSHEVAETGHMPMLMSKPEIDVIAAFLKQR